MPVAPLPLRKKTCAQRQLQRRSIGNLRNNVIAPRILARNAHAHKSFLPFCFQHGHTRFDDPKGTCMVLSASSELGPNTIFPTVPRRFPPNSPQLWLGKPSPWATRVLLCSCWLPSTLFCERRSFQWSRQAISCSPHPKEKWPSQPIFCKVDDFSEDRLKPSLIFVDGRGLATGERGGDGWNQEDGLDRAWCWHHWTERWCLSKKF